MFGERFAGVQSRPNSAPRRVPSGRGTDGVSAWDEEERESRMGIERRRHARAPFDANVTVAGPDGNWASAHLRDISMRGVYLLPDVPLADGDDCRVRVELAQQEGIEFRGTVVRRGPEGGVAIAADEMDVESFGHLYRLMALNVGDADRLDRELTGGEPLPELDTLPPVPEDWDAWD